MKNFLTDGLLDVAIILSLLRTDIHNLINSEYDQFNHYPEIQEIILGSTSAYTQTNFHNNNWRNSPGGFVHPKSVENFYESTIFRDLHSLGNYRRFEGVHTSINAYLASSPGAIPPSESEGASTSQGGNSHHSDNNNNDPETDPVSSASEQSLPTVANEGRTGNETQVSSSFIPGSELTKEDMAMIDILYNQDIDLGVGRETYDVNLRKEQEKNRELELEKEHEQERLELERRQREEEELQRQYQGNFTFITDGETGESIAVPVSSLPEDVQLQQQEQLQLQQQQQLQMQMQPHFQDMSTPMEANETSLDEAMRMLQESSDTPMDFLPDPASNLTSQQLEEQLQVLLQQQQQLENQQLNSTGLIVPEQLQHQQQQQQQQHQHLLQLQQQQQQQQMSPQLSPQINFTDPVPFQQSWQNLLNFNNTSDNTTMMGDVAMANSTNNGLIQNATLVQPDVSVTDFGFSQDLGINTTGGFTPFFTNGSGGVFPSVVPPSNSTLPSNETTLLNIDNRDLIFPNVTGVGSANSTFNESENLLQELLDDDLGDIDLTDLVIAEGIQGIQVVDEASSDSAVSSMGSSGCGMQDFSDMQSSPFDGIEGATGYSQTSPVKIEPKYENYDPEYNDPPARVGSDVIKTNHSSNETHFSREESATANPQHVRHNHSYPLKPGQEPRERKMTEEEKFQASLCRDERGIKDLNIPFSCHDIIHSPVERFNEMLTKYKLSEKQLQMIRDVRRRGKNKVAAQNCRKRKMDVIQTVEDELQNLRDEKERLIKERGTIDKEAADYRKMYESIHREVFQALRDDNGHPYDPSEFTLQQTSDGDVFIVPCNTTTRPAEGNHKEKTNRKRKGGRKGN